MNVILDMKETKILIASIEKDLEVDNNISDEELKECEARRKILIAKLMENKDFNSR